MPGSLADAAGELLQVFLQPTAVHFGRERGRGHQRNRAAGDVVQPAQELQLGGPALALLLRHQAEHLVHDQHPAPREALIDRLA
ncbi:MAG: hypothetical protein NTY53_01480 [Kiritimatiellaeota bacterium]|nr:hypothetical protein [Kiritimatiellota bacterium]